MGNKMSARARARNMALCAGHFVAHSKPLAQLWVDNYVYLVLQRSTSFFVIWNSGYQ